MEICRVERRGFARDLASDTEIVTMIDASPAPHTQVRFADARVLASGEAGHDERRDVPCGGWCSSARWQCCFADERRWCDARQRCAGRFIG